MICGECTERKRPDDFYRSNRATCKACVKDREAARNRANPEAHRQATRRWRERQQERWNLLVRVLEMVEARYPGSVFEAAMDAEDSLGLEPGTMEDLFSRIRQPG